MQNLNVTFENRNGETLSGILDLPTEEPVAYALFAHCFTCSKKLRAASNIATLFISGGVMPLESGF